MAYLDERAAALAAEIEAFGHGLGTETGQFVASVRGSKPVGKVVRLAVHHAVHEMLWTSGVLDYDEEHQTASLMGHLTAHFGWYTRAALENDELEGEQLPRIRWGGQSRRKEATTGADFILICDVDAAEGPDDYVRLALFQAKKTKHPRRGIESFAIDHVTGTPKLSVVSDDMITLMAAIGEEMAGDPSPESRAAVDQVLTQPAIKPRYQLESLLRTYFLGRRLTRERKQWCFYALWRGIARDRVDLPTAISLGNVARNVSVESGERLPSSYGHPGETVPFPDLVARCMTERDCDYGIMVRLGDIQTFLAGACELLPKLGVIVASPTARGDHAIVDALGSTFRFTAAGTPPAASPPKPKSPGMKSS